MAAPIPDAVRDTLTKDSFMKTCCVCGEVPQWHHAIIHAGSAVNEAWAIVPLCAKHHKEVNKKSVQDVIEWVAMNRATPEELTILSSVIDYKSKLTWLNSKYGDFTAKKIPYHYANARVKN